MVRVVESQLPLVRGPEEWLRPVVESCQWLGIAVRVLPVRGNLLSGEVSSSSGDDPGDLLSESLVTRGR
eukprot:10566616-Alexandrium_andersonii.AAC.1